jgi:hypothetical protein
MLRIDNNGSKANNTDTMIPKAMPCPIAFHEMLVLISTGKKSSSKAGR